MITTSVDWKSVGLDAGSNIEELVWKDCKRPAISLLNAKLFWNKTFTKHKFGGDSNIVTRFSHKIRNGSTEENKKHVLLSQTLRAVYACRLSILRCDRANSCVKG